MALKNYMPDIRFSGNLVTPDEIDRYEVVTVVNPSYAANWFATAVSSGPTGTATVTVGFKSKIADWPRNLNAIWTTGSGTKCGGTLTIVGQDQFGVIQTETLTKPGTTAATIAGTVCFSELTSVTAQQWTTANDIGTLTIGGGTLGTVGKLALPFKIGGTADVGHIAFSHNGTQQPINGGTIGAFIDATYHAIKLPDSIAGSCAITVWAKPTYVADDVSRMSNHDLLT